MSALKKCLSVLNKARVDEGLSVDQKKQARKNRSNGGYSPIKGVHRALQGIKNSAMGAHTKQRASELSNAREAEKHESFTDGFDTYSSAHYSNAGEYKHMARNEAKRVSSEMKNIKPKLVKAMEFLEKANRYEKETGMSREERKRTRNVHRTFHAKPEGVHTTTGSFGKKTSDKENAKFQHSRVSGSAKFIKPKLVKAIEFLEKARIDEGLSHQDKVNARASRHDRVSMLSGKIKGSVSREKMEQGVHRPTSGKNYGFTESSRLGDLVRRKDGGAKLEIKGTHKRLKNIKPKLVKAMQWLEQNDLQKGENDELAFHAERARAAQSANKNAIAKEHFLAFLKLATEQCKIASSIWGMRSLFNKTLDYYLDLADTKIYANNQNEISNGTNDAALVIYFKNGGKFENYKG